MPVIANADGQLYSASQFHVQTPVLQQFKYDKTDKSPLSIFGMLKSTDIQLALNCVGFRQEL